MKNIQLRKIYYHVRHRYATTNNIVVAVALLVALSWAVGSVSVMERNYSLQREVEDKQRQLTLLELEAQTLKFEQSYYKSDEYKDLAARQKLGLVTPGEKVLIVPQNTPQATAYDTANQPKPVETVPPSNMQQWLTFLLGGNSRELQK